MTILVTATTNKRVDSVLLTLKDSSSGENSTNNAD